jgi:hypothetical protein
MVSSPGMGHMTVSFKMDITTSGTHNGLFITTGIQNGGNTQMKQFGFIQPNQLSMNTPAAISLAPTPMPQLESGASLKDEPTLKSCGASTAPASIINEETTTTYEEVIKKSTLIDDLPKGDDGGVMNRSATSLSISSKAQQTQRTESPAPSLVNRTTDEFLRTVPFKINTFEEVRNYKACFFGKKDTF